MRQFRLWTLKIAEVFLQTSVLALILLLVANTLMYLVPSVLTDVAQMKERHFQMLPPALLISLGLVIALICVAMVLEPRDGGIVLKPGSNAKPFYGDENKG